MEAEGRPRTDTHWVCCLLLRRAEGEGPMSQGMQAAAPHCKRPGADSPLEPPAAASPASTLS